SGDRYGRSGGSAVSPPRPLLRDRRVWRALSGLPGRRCHTPCFVVPRALRTRSRMTPMPVDRTDSRPLHAQVADVLRAEIRDRSIPPGETLPSEAALRERFGVSRSVVRQALGTLI